jgi:hypothetical protein
MLMKQITPQHHLLELYYCSYTSNTFKQQYALSAVSSRIAMKRGIIRIAQRGLHHPESQQEPNMFFTCSLYIFKIDYRHSPCIGSG